MKVAKRIAKVNRTSLQLEPIAVVVGSLVEIVHLFRDEIGEKQRVHTKTNVRTEPTSVCCELCAWCKLLAREGIVGEHGCRDAQGSGE